MSTTNQQTDTKPLALFDNDDLPPWLVLHTRSRQEKAVARQLEAGGSRPFLPLAEQVRFYGRRKTKIHAPLFPSYVFLRGTREEAFLADRNNRLVTIIETHDQQLLNDELRSIAQALAQDVALDPCPYLDAGIRVQVRSGPMKGTVGVVESRTRAVNRIRLQIDTLGQAVSCEIDGNLLDILDD